MSRRLMPGPDVVPPDDIALLERMYRDYRDPARALAMRLLHDAHLAEDAVHQAFMQLITPLRAGDRRPLESDPRLAVLRNTRWAALNILSRRRSRLDVEQRLGVAASLANGEEWVRTEARLLCETILGGLPPRYLDVLRARYVDQDTDEVAARKLGLRMDTYRYRLRRALRLARQAARSSGMTHPSWAGALAWMRVAVRRRRLLRLGGGLGHAGASAVLVAGMVAGMAVRQAAGAPSGGSPALGASLVAQAITAASAETPDDVLLYSAATAHDAVVAVGWGSRCACSVALRSLDGGATWHAAPGPEDASHVVLPLDYPRDQRILAVGATTTVMAPRFGESFITVSRSVADSVLRAAATGRHVSVRRSGDAVLVTDGAGGPEIARLPIPAGVTGIASAAVAGTTVWALLDTADGGHLRQRDLRGGGWASAVRGGADAVPPRGTLVAVTPRRVLDLLPGGGLLCVADGVVWWAGCPA